MQSRRWSGHTAYSSGNMFLHKTVNAPKVGGVCKLQERGDWCNALPRACPFTCTLLVSTKPFLHMPFLPGTWLAGQTMFAL